jgi:hypothetical protein
MIVVYFKVILFHHLPVKTKENHETPSQDSRSLGEVRTRDLPNTKQEC